MFPRILVAFPLAIRDEAHAAVVLADKFLILQVRLDMNAHIATFGELFMAEPALVGLFLRVRAHMSFQGVVPRKLISALQTNVRLLLRVNSVVIFQMPLRRKCFIATFELAGERFNAVVLVLVVQQASFLKKLFVAKFTFVFR